MIWLRVRLRSNVSDVSVEHLLKTFSAQRFFEKFSWILTRPSISEIWRESPGWGVRKSEIENDKLLIWKIMKRFPWNSYEYRSAETRIYSQMIRSFSRKYIEIWKFIVFDSNIMFAVKNNLLNVANSRN